MDDYLSRKSFNNALRIVRINRLEVIDISTLQQILLRQLLLPVMTTMTEPSEVAALPPPVLPMPALTPVEGIDDWSFTPTMSFFLLDTEESDMDVEDVAEENDMDVEVGVPV